MKFTINNEPFDADMNHVEFRMRAQQPDPIHKYYVVVNEKRYPLNQVLQRITGLTRVECKTVYSVPILHRLGFKIRKI